MREKWNQGNMDQCGDRIGPGRGALSLSGEWKHVIDPAHLGLPYLDLFGKPGKAVFGVREVGRALKARAGGQVQLRSEQNLAQAFDSVRAAGKTASTTDDLVVTSNNVKFRLDNHAFSIERNATDIRNNAFYTNDNKEHCNINELVIDRNFDEIMGLKSRVDEVDAIIAQHMLRSEQRKSKARRDIAVVFALLSGGILVWWLYRKAGARPTVLSVTVPITVNPGLRPLTPEGCASLNSMGRKTC